MFHDLHINGQQARIRQAELQRQRQKLNGQNDHPQGSPVLTAIGRQLMNIGEQLQSTAQAAEMNTPTIA